jgi:hypothetical protein
VTGPTGPTGPTGVNSGGLRYLSVRNGLSSYTHTGGTNNPLILGDRSGTGSYVYSNNPTFGSWTGATYDTIFNFSESGTYMFIMDLNTSDPTNSLDFYLEVNQTGSTNPHLIIASGSGTGINKFSIADVINLTPNDNIRCQLLNTRTVSGAVFQIIKLA